MSSTLQSRVAFLSTNIPAQRMWIWGLRSGLSILDQGVVSGAGFLLNLFLARWLTSDAYGAFAVAFATLLFVFGFHSALLLEPISVMGPADYPHCLTDYFMAQLRVHALVVGALSGVLLAIAGVTRQFGAHRELVTAIAGTAFALPFLLMFWLVRRMCYVVQRPSMAVWGSCAYLCCLLAGLFGLHFEGWVTPFSAFLLMGSASVPAVYLLLWQLGLTRSRSTRLCPWKEVLRDNWIYGRWLVGGTVLFAVVSQVQTYLAAALLGLGAAGILRAMQIPSLVMTQVLVAVGLLVLPTMATEFGRGHLDQLRRKALLVSLSLTGIALAYAALLAIFAKPVERLIYGGRYASFAWLIPVLALAPVCTGFATGFSMALRACQKPHFDLLANVVSAPVGLLTAVVFIKVWGLAGAGVSLVVAFAVYAAVFLWSFKKLTSNGSRAVV